MLDNVELRYPHRASGAKAPRTLRPLPLLRFAASATGGAHLCSIQYYLRFWLSSCRTSLAVSALRIMRYCPKTISPADAEVILRLQGIFVLKIFLEFCAVECCVLYGFGTVKTVPYRALYIMCNERITCSVGRDTLIPPRRNLVGLCCACKPSVKLHKTNDLLFPRLFPNTIPKRPQFAAQCQIISVGIYDQICLVQAELAAFVQQALVHIHGNDFSQKQVVAA